MLPLGFGRPSESRVDHLIDKKSGERTALISLRNNLPLSRFYAFPSSCSTIAPSRSQHFIKWSLGAPSMRNDARTSAYISVLPDALVAFTLKKKGEPKLAFLKLKLIR
jgi:hypothetical protein